MAKTSIRKTTLIDLTGLTFNRLTVITRAENKPGRKEAVWHCACQCGSTTCVSGYRLRKGVTKSCGCLNRDMTTARNTTHGMVGSKEYASWRGMRARCRDSNNRSYPDYGGRGITVCKEWDESFASFFADMGSKPKGFTLERVNNDLGYFPENCKWAAKRDQARNKRTQKSCKSGVPGIYWYISRQKWQVTIYVNGKNIHIGAFNTFDAALEARKAAENKYWDR